ncbi:hypothetical protein C8R45DRAFT_1220414 [Mycena sanguinolenta]|nr:hypothetical protein C8R45DRAFT_1220414 [Mycena sanguinolenta]
MTTLPVELEREIFEICALSQPTCIPKLMLVAKHVKDWVERVFYRTILLGAFIAGVPLLPHRIVPSIISHKPPAFFHCVVRHLLAFTSRYPARKLEMILRLCTGVENLWISTVPETLILLVESLPLKHLSAPFESMPPPTSQMFSRLTHLRLAVHLDENMDSVWAFVVALPTLTHLSFSFDMYQHEGPVFPMVLQVSESSPTIQVLIIFTDSMMLWANRVPPDVRRDIRFVLMPYRDLVADWFAGVQHGTDYWSDAEAFIAKRQTGTIDPLTCVYSA